MTNPFNEIMSHFEHVPDRVLTPPDVKEIEDLIYKETVLLDVQYPGIYPDADPQSVKLTVKREYYDAEDWHDTVLKVEWNGIDVTALVKCIDDPIHLTSSY